MPIYEYECKACGTRFDKMQPIHAEPLVVCENCGKGPIRRVYHPVGVIFKGSGWYITDSRKSNKQETDTKSNSSETAEKAGSTESSSGSRESSDSAAKSADTPATSSPGGD